MNFVGQDEALTRAARAIRSGRPPQGWLISGPPGVGKATLAYRIARYVLKYGAQRCRCRPICPSRRTIRSRCKWRPRPIPGCWC